MSKHTQMDKEIKVLGIDLAKQSFQVHGVNQIGQVVFRKTLNREKLLECVVQLKPCLIGMEACGGAHDFARKFQEYGHTVRLMAPQFVKPYVKSNKNDRADAEAICEAVQRPNMRFVPIKSVDQQDLQSLHRVRSMVIAHRTALINQIRGLLVEYGIIIPKGASHVRSHLPDILADTANGLTAEMRELLTGLSSELQHLDECVGEHDAKVKMIATHHPVCLVLLAIPGIGPLIATALVASVGDPSVFKSGREMAAWLGLVPRQHSTGGKDRLLGISKRGDVYLRTLLIHGARAAIRVADKKEDWRSHWMVDLMARRGENIAAVALANKNVRIAWALLTKGEEYRSAKVA
jgi:transposase